MAHSGLQSGCDGVFGTAVLWLAMVRIEGVFFIGPAHHHAPVSRVAYLWCVPSPRVMLGGRGSGWLGFSEGGLCGGLVSPCACVLGGLTLVLQETSGLGRSGVEGNCHGWGRCGDVLHVTRWVAVDCDRGGSVRCSLSTELVGT